MAGYYVTHYVRRRAGGRVGGWRPQVWPPLSWTPLDQSIWAFIYVCCMDKILRFMYFWSPPPSVPPGGHKGQLFQILMITGRQFSENFMGAFLGVGLCSIILLPDIELFSMALAILNVLNFSEFLLNSRHTIWPIDMGLLIIKLYGHYSASHVIWSPPPIPVVTPGLKKITF